MSTLKFMAVLGCLIICQASFAKSEILLKPSANQRQAVKSAFMSTDNAQIDTAVNEAKNNIETLAINASCSMMSKALLPFAHPMCKLRSTYGAQPTA